MAAVPSQHLWAFFSPSEALPTYVAAPADAAAKDRILLLAKYAMQNGTSFVDMVRTNQGALSRLLLPLHGQHPVHCCVLY
jgi:hypothetical protein